MNKTNDIENNESILRNNYQNSIKKEILKYYPPKSNKKKMLLIGHDGFEGGAEILFKNLIKEFLNHDIEIVALLKCNGPMVKLYKSLVPTFIIDTQEKIEYYIDELNQYGFKNAITNTVLTGNIVSTLYKYDIFTISLIHELPNMIKFLQAENFAKIIANTSNIVVFSSSFVSEKFEELFPIKEKKIICPQGLYNKYDNFNKYKSRLFLKEKYDIPDENHIILNVGMGEKRKGFDLFFDVSKKLDENYTFIWVGSLDNEMEQEFLPKIKEQKNFILPGYISDVDELMRYYDGSDLFLLTSREDPFPSVVLEAFNAKKPVIGFKDAGGFQDIVIDNETGFLVDFESTDQLIEKIKLICENDELKNYLENNAKETCEQFVFSKYVETLKSYCFNEVNNKVDINYQNSDLNNIDSSLSAENSSNNLIVYLENKIRVKDAKISNLKEKNNQLYNYKNEISDYKSQIKSKNKQISSLKKKNQQLNKEKNDLLSSSSWKLTEPLRKFKYNVKKILRRKDKFQSNNASAKDTTSKGKNSNKNNKISSLENVHYMVYGNQYFYRTYIMPEYLKRVNLFIDNIDETIFEFDKLFSFLINFCNEYDHSLRIIYNNANFEVFKDFLKRNNLKLPDNVNFVYLKKDNYLEVGLDEKYVCTSWKNAKCLMNTYCINSVIYFYLSDFSDYTPEEYYQTSAICFNDNTIILNDNLNKLNQLKKLNFNYDIKINEKVKEDEKILVCDFGNFFIEGVELLNHLFLNNLIDKNCWKVFLLTKYNIPNFYLNSNVLINTISSNLENYHLFIKLDFSNSHSVDGNYINGYLTEEFNQNYNVINILEDECLISFNKHVELKIKKSEPVLSIGEIYKKIKEIT